MSFYDRLKIKTVLEFMKVSSQSQWGIVQCFVEWNINKMYAFPLTKFNVRQAINDILMPIENDKEIKRHAYVC